MSKEEITDEDILRIIKGKNKASYFANIRNQLKQEEEEKAGLTKKEKLQREMARLCELLQGAIILSSTIIQESSGHYDYYRPYIFLLKTDKGTIEVEDPRLSEE